MPERCHSFSLAFVGLALVLSAPASAASLQPSRAGLVRQSSGAHAAGFTFLANDAEVHDWVRKGELVAMRGNGDYHIDDDVRHAAARPEVKVFIERLARQYRAACGERLVVTSLVRPRSRQPWNSDPLSVHPTGMAVDLRISPVAACRRWLEDALLDLEADRLIEAARERVIPHYHVVVFPAYAAELQRRGVEVPTSTGAVLASSAGTGIDELVAALSAVVPAAGVVPAGLPAASIPLVAAAAQTAPAVERAARSVTQSKPTTTAKASTRKATTTRKSTTRRYIVRSGDTLWRIAKRHGVSVAAIKRANRVSSTIRPGQRLSIPAR